MENSKQDSILEKLDIIEAGYLKLKKEHATLRARNERMERALTSAYGTLIGGTSKDLADTLNILNKALCENQSKSKGQDDEPDYPKLTPEQIKEREEAIKWIRNPAGYVQEYTLAFIPCTEDDPNRCGGYTSDDGQSLCYVREVHVPAQQGDKSQFIRDYKQYKNNLKYLGGPMEWTEEKVNKLNKQEVFETIKGFNELISFFDSVLYAYEEGHQQWEGRCLKAESARQGAVWVRAKERPLIKQVNNMWFTTEDGDKDFIVAIPFYEKNDQIKLVGNLRWWIHHCCIEKGRLCIVGDDGNEIAGYEISDVEYWMPMPANPDDTAPFNPLDLIEWIRVNEYVPWEKVWRKRGEKTIETDEGVWERYITDKKSKL